MILVVGLSAVWQRTLLFDGLHLGEVNRARRVVETASGKGVNVARILGQLGLPARVLTVAGGLRGRAFRRALQRDQVKARVIAVAGETRTCQTVIARRSGAPSVVTELVEEAPGLSTREVRAVLAAYDRDLPRARMVILSGTVPNGCGDDFYARLTRRARRRDVPVLIDAQAKQLWKAVGEHPRLVKINRTELVAATGERDLRRAVATLRDHGAEQVVISQGSRAVWAVAPDNRFWITPPAVPAVNPIGSGDAMLAGIAAALVRGAELREAVRWGVACGAANALTATSGTIERSTVRRLLQDML